MRIEMRVRSWLVLGACTLFSSGPAAATSPRPPVDIRLEIAAGALVWTLEVEQDAAVVEARLRTVPPMAWDRAALPAGELAAGQRSTGRVSLDANVQWAEIVLEVRTAAGPMTLGGAARRPEIDASVLRAPVSVVRKPAARVVVRARCLYEQRLVGPGGYTGTMQRLPLRRVAVELVDAATDVILDRSVSSENGSIDVGPPSGWSGTVYLRLLSETHDPSRRVAVLEPENGSLENAVPHVLQTDPFTMNYGEIVDLGTLVFVDPDGFGRVQAFHILDLAFDAWDVLGRADYLGRPPALEDSLLLVWGPDLRIRSTGYGNGVVEVASPGSGDTDGWSDGIVLHEIGHHFARRFLRDSSPGGIHLLGDVEQELQLAWAEGLATAISCWVRQSRGVLRRNEAGESIDLWPTLFANVGLPPPANFPGGLQYAWDVDAYTLGGAPLARDGTGSEVNVAGVLWDATDGGAGDDDPVQLGWSGVFFTLHSMRELPRGTRITFEDFWRRWMEWTGSNELAPLLEAARIEYVLDEFEPDDHLGAPLDAWVENEAPGGVVLAEIHPGPRIAVELVNRGSETVALDGWTLVARSNTSSGNPALTYTIPPGVHLGPGARIVVWRGGRTRDNGPRDLYASGWTVPWFPRFEGACTLFDAQGSGVDFVRWSAMDGSVSKTPPPAGVGWNGEVTAPDFGSSLQRRSDAVDADTAGEFAVGPPTLGTPNGTPAVHRTFFPEADRDRTLYRAPADGVYTVRTRGLRSGAEPRLEIHTSSGTVRTSHAPGEARLTLRLAAGEIVTAVLVQDDDAATRLGSYDLTFVREADAGTALPPVGLATSVHLNPAGGRVRVDWHAGAMYDSVLVRAGDGPWTALPGEARTWSFDLSSGRHSIEIVGVTRDGRAAAPTLVVAVEPLPTSIVETFDAALPVDWETTGAWGTTASGGRTGVLASSPDGPYPNDSFGMVRQRSAVVVGEGTQIRLVHACIVRPEDTARLEASADWGATWTPLASFDWNDHRGNDEAADWRDGVLDPEDWVEETIPLPDWDGRPVQVRFVFESELFGTAAGWFVDELRIEAGPAPPPTVPRLDPAFPNPFNPGTTLRFAIPTPGAVELRIYDLRGRLVRELVRAWYPAGVHTIPWDSRDADGRLVASGMYFAALRTGGSSIPIATKLTVLR